MASIDELVKHLQSQPNLQSITQKQVGSKLHQLLKHLPPDFLENPKLLEAVATINSCTFNQKDTFVAQLQAFILAAKSQDIDSFTVLDNDNAEEALTDYLAIILGVYALLLASDWNKFAAESKETIRPLNIREQDNPLQSQITLTRALAQTLVDWFKTHSMTPRLIDALPMPAMVIRMINPAAPTIVRINRACDSLLSSPADIDLNHERMLADLFPNKDDLTILVNLLNNKQKANNPWEFETTERPIELSLSKKKREAFFANVAKLPWYNGQSALLLLTEPFEEGSRDDLFQKIFSTVPAAVEVRVRMPNNHYRRIAASNKFKEWFPYAKDKGKDKSTALNDHENFQVFSNPSWFSPFDLFIYQNPTVPSHQIDTKQTNNQRRHQDFPEISELRCFRYQIVELSFLSYHFQLHWLQNVTTEWLYRAEQEASLRITRSLVRTIMTSHKIPGLFKYSRPMNDEVGGDFFWARYLDDEKSRFILVMGDFPSQSTPAALMTAVAGMTLDHIQEELRKQPENASPVQIRNRFKAEIDKRLSFRNPLQDTTAFANQLGSKLDLLVLTLSRQDGNIVLRYTLSGIALFRLNSGTGAKQLASSETVMQKRVPFFSNAWLPGNTAIAEWESNFESDELILEPGDHLVLCTDGLIKQSISAQNPEPYGSLRLTQLLNEHVQTEDGQQLLEAIKNDWQSAVSKDTIADDVLVLTITPGLVLEMF